MVKMIYVNVELWPHGNSQDRLTLFEAIIHNTGGDTKTGIYEYLISKRGGFRAVDASISRADVKHVLRRGIIEGFPRLRLGAAELLFRCLREGFG